MPGIVMLVGRDPVSNIMYHAVSQTFPVMAVIRETKPEVSTLLKRRVKKLGLGTVLGQLMFKLAVVPVVAFNSKARLNEIIHSNRLNTSEIPAEVVIEVTSVNSDSAIRELKRLAPKVVVVNGTRIIKEEVLNSTDAVFLNTHAGITPMYRGVHGGYWALASNDPQNCGVTVHRVDKGIDTGSIVAQADITYGKRDSFVTYPFLQTAAAIPLLKKAIAEALHGTISQIPPRPGKSQLWSHPTVWQYMRNRLTLGIR